jgi:hypothetical protein
MVILKARQSISHWEKRWRGLTIAWHRDTDGKRTGAHPDVSGGHRCPPGLA